MPDSAWNMLAYFGSTTITNFSAEQKANKNALIVPFTTTGDTLRTGMVQVSVDDTLTSYTATNDYAGHTFGKLGQGKRTMATWKTTNEAYTQTSYQFTDGNQTQHGMIVSILPYDGTATLASSGVIEINAHSIPFANNTKFLGSPIAPN